MFHFTCKQTTLLSSPYVASVGIENNFNCYSKVLPLVVKCVTIFFTTLIPQYQILPQNVFYENWEVQNANFCAPLNC